MSYRQLSELTNQVQFYEALLRDIYPKLEPQSAQYVEQILKEVSASYCTVYFFFFFFRTDRYHSKTLTRNSSLANELQHHLQLSDYLMLLASQVRSSRWGL